MTQVRRLKYVADIRFSSVDKKTVDGQIDVRLCNYTDVYYNERILGDIKFMDATATPDQIATYTLRAGDVLFTKDSETADDIGVSAFVAQDLPGVLCGYHLAIARPRPSALDGRYLRWALVSTSSRQQLELAASGVTRFGLRQDAVGGMMIPTPPLRSQLAIADYLDAETAQIDALIGLRRQQLALNSSRRFEAVRAAFREPGTASGGVSWVPGAPIAWPMIHLRWLTSCLDGRRIPVNREDRASMQGDIPYWGANGVVDHVDAALFDEPLVLLGEDGAPFFDREKPKAFFVDTPVWVNNHIHVLRAHGIRPRFLMHYLNLVDYADFVGGSTRDKLTQGDMGSIPVPVPPISEQERIEQEISVSQRWADEFEAATERQIDLLIERRQALITAAVTGDLDIPGVVA